MVAVVSWEVLAGVAVVLNFTSVPVVLKNLFIACSIFPAELDFCSWLQ